MNERRSPRGGLDRAVFLPYDPRRYDFASAISEVLGFAPLAALHDHVLAAKREAGNRAELTYADNLAQRRKLARQPDDAPFYEVYNRFLTEVIAPRFGGWIGYTVHPTFRVHMAGTTGVSKWHTDVEVIGHEEYINGWLPFTSAADTNTIWVESDYGLEDYAPVPVAYGEALIFDGGCLRHGSVPNTSNATRVSMDFRFVVRRADRPNPDLGVLSGRPAP